MNLQEVAWQRFFNQGLLQPRFETPAEVVAWNGAVQAQDYSGAKWAVAQRTRDCIPDAAIEEALTMVACCAHT